MTSMDYMINCDGYSPLHDLAMTAMTERDAVEQLILPIARTGLTGIDWTLLTTGRHNCRTPHDLTFSEDEQARMAEAYIRQRADAMSAGEREARRSQRVARVRAFARMIRHYNNQKHDLLDIVIREGRAHGLTIFAGVRLNHANDPAHMAEVPGPAHANGMRKDFRSEAFQNYLLRIYESLLERGLDGLTLDFERKAPFFPPDTPPDERFDACRSFVRKVRALDATVRLAARVAHDPEKGGAQGQAPLQWLREGLLDAVIPATHNHEPDDLSWGIAPYVEAVRASPRPCKLWPQIWPTAERWTHPGGPDDDPERWHTPEAALARVDDLRAQGADGVYFFNWFPWPEHGQTAQRTVAALDQLPQRRQR